MAGNGMLGPFYLYVDLPLGARRLLVIHKMNKNSFGVHRGFTSVELDGD
jgi:hypothetical protein